MNNYKKVAGGIAVLVLLLLSLTNPSIKEFEEFAGVKNGQEYTVKQPTVYTSLGTPVYNTKVENHLIRKESNWLIFSKFKHNSESYIGVLNNFYKSE